MLSYKCKPRSVFGKGIFMQHIFSYWHWYLQFGVQKTSELIQAIVRTSSIPTLCINWSRSYLLYEFRNIFFCIKPIWFDINTSPPEFLYESRPRHVSGKAPLNFCIYPDLKWLLDFLLLTALFYSSIW